MRKTTLVCLIAALGFISINKIHSGHKLQYPLIESDIRREDSNPSAREEEEDGMQEAMEQEFRLTKDPALNEVPRERLIPAMHVRDQRLSAWRGSVRTMAAIPGVNWTERGPVNVGGR